ncbi:BRO family protein [Bacillus albus]|uniref:BRO-N domain-containing protein n=1 Tax=Bacillus albus TaxID=2026189 RepID=UPI001FBB0F52
MFLAKDVAEWIGHTNLTVMMRLVEEDEKVKAFLPLNNVYTQTGRGGLRENTEANFLTENGIYEVLMQSRKPIAKQWKKEVKKILKQIRLTGGTVQTDREAEFIENYFPSFSEDVKKAMVLDLHATNKELQFISNL